jgi:uncharacterized protein
VEGRPDSKVVVRSYKYDGSLHREWSAEVLQFEEPLIVLRGVFEQQINHPLLGVIEAGTISTEYFRTDRWYAVFVFTSPDKRLRNYYCNIHTPPEFSESTLRFTDLDVDIIVNPDLSYTVADEEEFGINSTRYNYSAEIRSRVAEALSLIIDDIDKRRSPFNLSEIT